MNVILWILGLIAAVAIIFVAAVGTYAVLKGKANELNTRRDVNGNLILLDTPSMRRRCRLRVRPDDRDGEAGTRELRRRELERPLAGYDPIDPKNTENPEWYVQYIIEQRRKAGLPELEGVDEAWP